MPGKGINGRANLQKFQGNSKKYGGNPFNFQALVNCRNRSTAMCNKIQRRAEPVVNATSVTSCDTNKDVTWTNDIFKITTGGGDSAKRGYDYATPLTPPGAMGYEGNDGLNVTPCGPNGVTVSALFTQSTVPANPTDTSFHISFTFKGSDSDVVTVNFHHGTILVSSVISNPDVGPINITLEEEKASSPTIVDDVVTYNWVGEEAGWQENMQFVGDGASVTLTINGL